MTYEQNVKAILECNFAQTKDELIDIACKNICKLSRWIPCSERLPEESGYYLVTDTTWGAPIVEIDAFSKEGMFWLMANPIAWMPLPEIYEESEVEE